MSQDSGQVAIDQFTKPSRATSQVIIAPAPSEIENGMPPDFFARGRPGVALPAIGWSDRRVVRLDGSVADVTVRGESSAGAVAAVKKYVQSCKYKPVLQEGKPVEVRWQVDFNAPH